MKDYFARRISLLFIALCFMIANLIQFYICLDKKELGSYDFAHLINKSTTIYNEKGEIIATFNKK